MTCGMLPITAEPSSIAPPYCSANAFGMQINYILLEKGWYVFFKYEAGYMATVRPQGHAIVFGFAYTLRIPNVLPQHS